MRADAAPPVSAVSLLPRWAAQRLPWTLFLPLAGVLASVGTLAGAAGPDVQAPWTVGAFGAPGGGVAAWLARSAIALLLLATLRLWDDLADIEADRAREPDRLLCRLDSTRPAQRLLGALLVLSTLAVLAGGGHLLPWASGLLALALYYGPGRVVLARHGGELAARHALLFKYPLLAATLAPVTLLPLSSACAASLAALFGAIGLYEVLHDARNRAARGFAPWLAFDALTLLAGTALALTLA